MLKRIFSTLILGLSILACTKATKDPLSILSPEEATVIEPPALGSLSYIYLGQTVTLNAPFTQTQDIIVDSGLGGCTSSQAHLTFTGTYNSETVTKLELLGLLSQTTQLNAGSFTTVACLPRGASAIKIRGVNADNKKSAYISLSLNVSSGITTIAWGHPAYPAPGFRINSNYQAAVVSDKGIDLGNTTIESSTAKKIQSTGNTSLTFETGYLNMVEQSL